MERSLGGRVSGAQPLTLLFLFHDIMEDGPTHTNEFLSVLFAIILAGQTGLDGLCA